MSDESRTAARGGLAVLTAKVYFIGTGLIQQALLPLAIGLADYGALSRVLSPSNVVNNVIVSSATQGVSRTVAGAGDQERAALRATLRIHLGIALVAAGLLAVAAPFIASFQHSPEILAPLLVMTGVLFVYGVYAPLIGYFNGRRQFTRQAALDIVAATLRTAGLLGAGALFVKYGATFAASVSTSPGVLGATVGAVCAASGVFLLALRWSGTGATGAGGPTVRAYVASIVPIMVAQLFTNALMQADIFILGRYLSIAAADLPDGAKQANEWVAVYRACQLFAFLPYQLLFSVTQILFPMLAKANAEDGPERVKELVARGSRIGAIVCGLLVSVIVALPYPLIRFAYGSEVAHRGDATLWLLAFGQAAFAMTALAMTILVSLGRERVAMLLTATSLALLVSACSYCLPRAVYRGAPLWLPLLGAAVAATWALMSALAIAVVVIRRVAGTFIPWKTALRVGLCIAAFSPLSRVLFTESRMVTIAYALMIAILYVAALIATRELGRSDLEMLLALAGRRRATKG